MQDTAGPSTSALRQRPGRGGAGPSSNKASATEIGTSEDLDLVDEEWKKGRRVLTRELERVINCDTFEQFVLLRRNRPVGRLKGFVQVFDGSTGYAEEEERKKALLKVCFPPLDASPTSAHLLAPPHGVVLLVPGERKSHSRAKLGHARSHIPPTFHIARAISRI